MFWVYICNRRRRDVLGVGRCSMVMVVRGKVEKKNPLFFYLIENLSICLPQQFVNLSYSW